jgi:hypothetical protein
MERAADGSSKGAADAGYLPIVSGTDEEHVETRWTFDDALQHVGGWGKHQKWSMVYCGIPWLVSGMFAFGPVTWSPEMMKANAWGDCRDEQTANTVYFAFNVVGNLVAGPLADSFGRRPGERDREREKVRARTHTHTRT